MWSLGDYSEMSPLLEPYAVELAASCGLRPGMRVLDVAAGNGNFALAAARSRTMVTASDLTPRMLEMGRERSDAAGMAITWIEGDAEALPVEDSSFDVVASVFGAMFAPRAELVAGEMFRACARGGVVAMANYGWEGYLGSFARLLAKYSGPPPPGLHSPFEWGDPSEVERRFAGLASQLDLTPGVVGMTFASVDEGLAFFERTNGPHIALKSLSPPDKYEDFMRDTRELMRSMNRSTEGRLRLESAYLKVVARK